jgi:hypothetical protein
VAKLRRDFTVRQTFAYTFEYLLLAVRQMARRFAVGLWSGPPFD